MMHKWIACLLMTALVAAWSAAAAAQSVPEEARRHMARGIAAIEMAKSAGDYVLAALEFEKAAKLAPDWPDVYYSLGSVQAKMGDPASAIKSYQRYLELAPRSPDAEKVRQEIYKLEYLHDRQKQAAALSGAWKASNGQTFKLLLDGSRLQLTRDEQQGDDILTISVDGQHEHGPHDGCAAAGFFRNPDRGKNHGDVCPGGRQELRALRSAGAQRHVRGHGRQRRGPDAARLQARDARVRDGVQVDPVR